MVVTPHYHPPRTRRGRVHQRTLGRLTSRADAVLAVSQFELDALRSAGFRPHRIAIVPPAVDEADRLGAAAGVPEIEDLLGWRLESRRVIAVLGRVEPHKHVDDVVRALPDIVRRSPDAALVIAGPVVAEVAQSLGKLAAALGVDDRVSVLGRLTSNQKAALLAGASLVVSASEYEAFGISLLEALSYGTPVVGARAAAVPELLEHREELLFTCGDTSEMAGKVNEVLSSPASDRALRAWALRRAGDFSPEAFAGGLLSGYEMARAGGR